MTHGLSRVRVSGREQLAPGAFLLRLEGKLEFVPGQNVNVTVDPRLPPRAYSIAGGTSDPFTEILFTVIEGGRLTPLLARLEPGDPLYLSQPFGSFHDDGSPAWWIAGGTGVAPFRAMVLSGAGGPAGPGGRVLVQGSRRPERLYFCGLFAGRLGAGYRPCSSGPGAGPGVHAGRLADYLRELAPPADGRYLLCGGAEMVVGVRETLLGCGVPFMSIQAEIFF